MLVPVYPFVSSEVSSYNFHYVGIDRPKFCKVEKKKLKSNYDKRQMIESSVSLLKDFQAASFRPLNLRARWLIGILVLLTAA